MAARAAAGAPEEDGREVALKFLANEGGAAAAGGGNEGEELRAATASLLPAEEGAAAEENFEEQMETLAVFAQSPFCTRLLEGGG